MTTTCSTHEDENVLWHTRPLLRGDDCKIDFLLCISNFTATTFFFSIPRMILERWDRDLTGPCYLGMVVWD